MTPLYIFLNKKRYDPSFLQVLERLNLYASNYASRSNLPEAKLTVFTNGEYQDNNSYYESNFPFLRIFKVNGSRINVIGFALQILRTLRVNGIKPSILIAGDPIHGFLVAKILKTLSCLNTPIQIQIHGDLSIVFKRERLLLTLRNLIILINVRFSQSVRVVAIHQIQQLTRFYPKINNRCFVAPIPIDVPKTLYVQKKSNSLHIGFLGRFHAERGVREWLTIALTLLETNPNAIVGLAGSGPELRNFSNQINQTKFVNRVKFFGNVSGIQKEDFFNWCSVLLSTAPTEGFGMSIRESILRGIPVVAFSNSGTKAFKGQFPDSVEIYIDKEEVLRILQDIDLASLSEVTVELNRKQQSKVNQESICSLIDSWIQFEFN